MGNFNQIEADYDRLNERLSEQMEVDATEWVELGKRMLNLAKSCREIEHRQRLRDMMNLIRSRLTRLGIEEELPELEFSEGQLTTL